MQVGSTISCEGAPLGGDPSAVWRQNPHVQSYVLATDQTGLAILQRGGQVFSCYDNLHDTIYFAELGSSLAVLEAGFNIDSLMLRYQVRKDVLHGRTPYNATMQFGLVVPDSTVVHEHVHELACA